jgi:uncharacterized membrane protein YfcA
MVEAAASAQTPVAQASFGAIGTVVTGFLASTLLAFFALATASRILMTGAAGAIDGEVLVWVAASLPAVLLGTWAGRRFPPHLPDRTLRRIAFGLLALLGLTLLVS